MYIHTHINIYCVYTYIYAYICIYSYTHIRPRVCVCVLVSSLLDGCSVLGKQFTFMHISYERVHADDQASNSGHFRR